MLDIAFIAVNILTLPVTSYRSVPNQTDDSPFITSIGHHVHPYGIAVSQDLLASGAVCYGDLVEVPGYGIKVVNDVMNKRHIQRMDVWVKNYKEEKAFGTRTLSVRVWRSETRACSRKEAMK